MIGQLESSDGLHDTNDISDDMRMYRLLSQASVELTHGDRSPFEIAQQELESNPFKGLLSEDPEVVKETILMIDPQLDFEAIAPLIVALFNRQVELYEGETKQMHKLLMKFLLPSISLSMSYEVEEQRMLVNNIEIEIIRPIMSCLTRMKKDLETKDIDNPEAFIQAEVIKLIRRLHTALSGFREYQAILNFLTSTTWMVQREDTEGIEEVEDNEEVEEIGENEIEKVQFNISCEYIVQVLEELLKYFPEPENFQVIRSRLNFIRKNTLRTETPLASVDTNISTRTYSKLSALLVQDPKLAEVAAQRILAGIHYKAMLDLNRVVSISKPDFRKILMHVYTRSEFETEHPLQLEEAQNYSPTLIDGEGNLNPAIVYVVKKLLIMHPSTTTILHSPRMIALKEFMIGFLGILTYTKETPGGPALGTMFDIES